MLVKAVTLFLIAMLVLGMFGKLRLPRVRGPKRKQGIAKPGKCPTCGSYIIGAGPCRCQKPTR